MYYRAQYNQVSNSDDMKTSNYPYKKKKNAHKNADFISLGSQYCRLKSDQNIFPLNEIIKE